MCVCVCLCIQYVCIYICIYMYIYIYMYICIYIHTHIHTYYTPMMQVASQGHCPCAHTCMRTRHPFSFFQKHGAECAVRGGTGFTAQNAGVGIAFSLVGIVFSLVRGGTGFMCRMLGFSPQGLVPQVITAHPVPLFCLFFSF